MPTTFVILLSTLAPLEARCGWQPRLCCPLSADPLLAGWLISTGRLSIAAAGAALVAIRLLASQVQSGLSGVQAVFESGQFIDDLDGFLTLAPAAEGGSREIAPPADFQRIRADAVSFAYPGRSALALQAASIEINQGEVVALVGLNGSGKTTLAKVMAGLYEPGSGAVRGGTVST